MAPMEKKASSPTAMKHKSTSKAEKADPVSGPTNPPRSRPPLTRTWEEWEDQLMFALRKEGKTDRQISQHLPGRSEGACRTRHCKVKARSQKVSTQQKDGLASPAPRRQYWSKDWEDWEDRIIVTHRNAGESWGNIRKLLPHRSAGSVTSRWKRGKLFLEPQPQDTVDLQAQSPNTPSIPRPVKYCCQWKQGEEQLLISLRELGKSYAEIATQLPNRSVKGCRSHWLDILHKRQSLSAKSAARSGLQWEEWEERLLVSGYYAGLSWKKISEPITGRTKNGCLNQWINYFRSSDQDEPWTSEELARLEYLRSEGSGWDEISQELPGHSSNACRTQWYKETEGIQGPASHQGNYDTWSAEEVEVLIAIYNTIGPRWQEICKHIPGRTRFACETWFRTKCTKEDGVGGPPSEYWKEFFKNEQGPGDGDSDPTEATSDTHFRDESSTPRLTKNQPSSVDTRKRKIIDIPMV